jgi:hypothetical protein
MTRRIWLSFDATWFSGGQTAVNGLGNPDRQDNVRMGATLSLPLIARQSLKVTYSSGTTTRRGSDYDTFTIGWQAVRLPVQRRPGLRTNSTPRFTHLSPVN